MGDLSPHFDTREAECGCGCGFGRDQDDIDMGLVAMLEDMREAIGRPIFINSWCRCYRHNAAVGGVTDSIHTLGQAVDIRVYGGKHKHQVEKAAYFYGATGVGTGKTFVHVDVHEGYLKPRPSAWGY